MTFWPARRNGDSVRYPRRQAQLKQCLSRLVYRLIVAGRRVRAADSSCFQIFPGFLSSAMKSSMSPRADIDQQLASEKRLERSETELDRVRGRQRVGADVLLGVDVGEALERQRSVLGRGRAVGNGPARTSARIFS